MKKIFIALCVLSFLLAAPTAQAWQTVKLEVEDYTTYEVDKTTGYDQTTNIAVTTIIPGTHSILGYAIMSLKGHEVNGTVVTGESENYLSVWDEISGTSNPIGIGPEIESVDGSYEVIWFPRPKPFFIGITVRQGANTRASILYE